jgi:DASS family divalent anion:Na+ symporter
MANDGRAEAGAATPAERNRLVTARPIPLLITVAVACVIWFWPPPEGVSDQAWHLLAIFVATIVGIIAKPLPMGAVALIGVTATALTGTLSLGDALSGFSSSTIWLIGVAFFVSRAIIKTGLGARIAYHFMKLFGRNTLGLSYGLGLADLVLAPAMPSNTARAGGVLMPLLRSVSLAYDSDPAAGTERRIGSFMMLNGFQINIITSAMFLTAMAANPLAAELALDVGVELTWGGWFLAALAPGLVSLIVIPLFVYLVYRPEIRSTPQATTMAQEALAEMGPVTPGEKVTMGVMGLLLVLWIFGSNFGINATTAALTGLAVLLLAGVLSWQDILAEKGAWDTIVWFAALVMMATQLNQLGFIAWFGDTIGAQVEGMAWTSAFLILGLVYFYSHYLFASQTAHISAMYAPFLAVAVAVGTPPALAALVLAFFSNLFSSLTHYANGPAPVIFGADYVPMNAWWGFGFAVSLLNIAIWVGIGWFWWDLIGLMG